jgi:mono/diheme cytochrome c family protein
MRFAHCFTKGYFGVCLAAMASLLASAAWAVGVAHFHRPLQIQELTSPTRVGKDLFRQRCLHCHSVESSISYCPTLMNVGNWAGTRREGMTKEEYLLESIVDPSAFRVSESSRMPYLADTLTDMQIREIVRFLCSQGGEVNPGRIDSLEVKRPAKAAMTRHTNLELLAEGERLFFGKGGCVKCHFSGSLLGPNLEQLSGYDEHYLRETMLHPEASISSHYRQSIIQLDDDTIQIGRIIGKNDEHITILQMLPGGAQLKEIPWGDIAVDDDGKPAIKDSSQSMMPSYAETLSSHELDALVELLRSLR